MISAISGSVSTKDLSISCELSVFESLDKGARLLTSRWDSGSAYEAMILFGNGKSVKQGTVDRSARRVSWIREDFVYLCT